MDAFSNRITHARKRMGLSQSQLAGMLGVSRGACGQWEQDVSLPSVAHMAELARLMEVSFEWLATGRGEMELTSCGSPDVRAPGEPGRELSGRPLTGDLREVTVWMQKLPKDQFRQVVRVLRNVRSLMGEAA